MDAADKARSSATGCPSRLESAEPRRGPALASSGQGAMPGWPRPSPAFLVLPLLFPLPCLGPSLPRGPPPGWQAALLKFSSSSRSRRAKSMACFAAKVCLSAKEEAGRAAGSRGMDWWTTPFARRHLVHHIEAPEFLHGPLLPMQDLQCQASFASAPPLPIGERHIAGEVPPLPAPPPLPPQPAIAKSSEEQRAAQRPGLQT